MINLFLSDIKHDIKQSFTIFHRVKKPLILSPNDTEDTYIIDIVAI